MMDDEYAVDKAIEEQQWYEKSIIECITDNKKENIKMLKAEWVKWSSSMGKLQDMKIKDSLDDDFDKSHLGVYGEYPEDTWLCRLAYIKKTLIEHGKTTDKFDMDGMESIRDYIQHLRYNPIY